MRVSALGIRTKVIVFVKIENRFCQKRFNIDIDREPVWQSYLLARVLQFGNVSSFILGDPAIFKVGRADSSCCRCGMNSFYKTLEPVREVC